MVLAGGTVSVGRVSRFAVVGLFCVAVDALLFHWLMSRDTCLELMRVRARCRKNGQAGASAYLLFLEANIWLTSGGYLRGVQITTEKVFNQAVLDHALCHTDDGIFL